MAVGRISGPLLKDNLLRNGVNLAFETNLLYLDVVNGRVGINTATPSNDLSVNGTTTTNNLFARTSATVGTFTLTGNTLSSTSSQINLLPQGSYPVVYQGTINVGNLAITANSITATNANGNLILAGYGAGQVQIASNTLINGNLHATGNITADGNIQLGNQTSDTISFTGEVNSDILPSANNTYNLGSNSLNWNNVYATTATVSSVSATTVTATDFQTAGIDISGTTISTLAANSNLNFVTTGTGGIVLNNLKFYQNTITNISPGAVTSFTETAKVVTFTGSIANGTAVTFTGSISGSTLTVTSTPSGTGLAVGLVIGGTSVLAGTYITANLTGTGTSSSSTWTVSNSQVVGSEAMTAVQVTLTVTGSPSGTIQNGMLITGGTVATNTNIIGLGSGSGSAGTYYLGVAQTVVSSSLTGTITGFVNFSGTYGVVIPTGNGTTDRPSLATTEVGMIRFNTDQQYVEVYNGIVWTSIAGATSGVSINSATDIALGIVLSLG
jgi:hypothetical protein